MELPRWRQYRAPATEAETRLVPTVSTERGAHHAAGWAAADPAPQTRHGAQCTVHGGTTEARKNNRIAQKLEEVGTSKTRENDGSIAPRAERSPEDKNREKSSDK